MKKITLLAIFLRVVILSWSQDTVKTNIPKYKADLDTRYDKGSAITSIPLDRRSVNDLYITAKVWGFVKYYHPALQSGNYNWDYELFSVLPAIIQCKNDKERNEILFVWINRLGKFEKGSIELPDSSEVKLYPDIQWINDKATLGDQLSMLLHEVKNAKRQITGYYLTINNKSVRTPGFENEKAYADIQFPDAGFRLLALFRYWNIIQYCFPYKYLIEENWNNVLTEFIPKLVNAANEQQYTLTILALITRVRDSHANIYGSRTLKQYKGLYSVPIDVRFVENKLVVIDYLNKELGPKSGFQKGDIITMFNAKSIDSIVKDQWHIAVGSNEPTQLRNLSFDLLRSNNKVANITYQRGNEIKTTEVTCYPDSLLAVNNRYRREGDTCFRFVTPDISCIYLGTMKKEYLLKAMPEILKTKGLIIDLRCYPKEPVLHVLAQYLFPRPMPVVKWSALYRQMPGMFKYDGTTPSGKNNNDYYKGHVVVIINELTQSQAEYTAMVCRMAPQATVIGSTTAGADGNVTYFNLPGKIFTGITGLGVYYADGRETQRIGIIPDITIRPTIEGIRQGRDELLEKAVALINGI